MPRTMSRPIGQLLLLCTLFAVPIGLAGWPARVAQLAWLTGCWTSDGREPGSGEQWSRPAGGSMIGASRAVRDGRTVAYEFLRIFETDDGSLVYVAAPSGQATNAFSLLHLGEHEVVFADPEHDFPQRILYRLLDPQHLLARIEGESDGQLRGVDFPMTRSRCRG